MTLNRERMQSQFDSIQAGRLLISFFPPSPTFHSVDQWHLLLWSSECDRDNEPYLMEFSIIRCYKCAIYLTRGDWGTSSVGKSFLAQSTPRPPPFRLKLQPLDSIFDNSWTRILRLRRPPPCICNDRVIQSGTLSLEGVCWLADWLAGLLSFCRNETKRDK